MDIVRLEPKNNGKSIAEAVAFLNDNKVIIIPTDTVYGLAADACSVEALGALLAVKERAHEKGFPLFVNSIAVARRFAYIDKQKEEFLKMVWPGQVTVVLQAKDTLPKIATGGRNTVALRMPDTKFVIDVVAALGRPITGTSANISGTTPVRTVEEAVEKWHGKTSAPAAAYDSGPLTAHPPSTIVDITNDNPIVLRQGVMTKNELDKILTLSRRFTL